MIKINNNWEKQLYLMLDNTFGIKTLDENNLVLFKRVVRKKHDTKDEYNDEETIGYYSTLREALRAYSKYSVRACDSKVIQSLHDKLDSIEKAITILYDDFQNYKGKRVEVLHALQQDSTKV